jgi:hypothetical protein
LKLALLLVATAAAAQNVPKSACDFDGFDVNSRLAEVAAPATAYYGCGTGKCLPMPLKAGDPMVISRADGAWTCGYLVSPKGSAQGWIHSLDIRPVAFDLNPPLSAWVGSWGQDRNHILIRVSNGKLHIEGEAYWHGGGNNVHSGSLSGEASPMGHKLRYSESDACTVDLALLGKYLLANDNNMCGGANVRFWGIWRRAHLPDPLK